MKTRIENALKSLNVESSDAKVFAIELINNKKKVSIDEVVFELTKKFDLSERDARSVVDGLSLNDLVVREEECVELTMVFKAELTKERGREIFQGGKEKSKEFLGKTKENAEKLLGHVKDGGKEFLKENQPKIDEAKDFVEKEGKKLFKEGKSLLGKGLKELGKLGDKLNDKNKK